MLFPYKFVGNHAINKMHTYIKFIFEKVWCEAKGKDYDVEQLFADNEELKDIIVDLHYLETANFFLEGIQTVFEEFKKLDDDDITKFKNWFISNNNIEGLCNNEAGLNVIRYDEIKDEFPKLTSELKKFYSKLYSGSFLSLKPLKDELGDIKKHFNDFSDYQPNMNKGKCPFCGVSNMKNKNFKGYDSYDHYLPKAKFPFNSINFLNLAPTCHECNSGYKGTKDPLEYAGKTFYPFSNEQYQLSFTINLNNDDWESFEPDDISISYGPATLENQINTWRTIYGIDERYKALCCGENDGQYWIEQVLDECENEGKTALEVLETRKRLAKKRPYADVNFLRVPFLEACDNSGLFNGN